LGYLSIADWIAMLELWFNGRLEALKKLAEPVLFFCFNYKCGEGIIRFHIFQFAR